MLGTSKPSSAGPGVAHEGYGGWKWLDFLSKFDPKPPEVAAGPMTRKSTSPFVFRDASGRGRLDIQRYRRIICDPSTESVRGAILAEVESDAIQRSAHES